MPKRPVEHPALRLPATDPETGRINAIVETPQHSRNKFVYDPKSWLFRLGAVLPEGVSFPHAFGFIPSTLGDDGDPLDIMILMDSPVYPGCIVPSRLIGVMRARQAQRDGEVEQNDRLIAVSADSRAYANVTRVEDLPEAFKTEIEEFFIFYNRARDKVFTPTEWQGPRAAAKLVEVGHKAHASAQRRGKRR
jgi:inorganic pyrophosphatase